jgi:hypothetical protein
MDEATNAYLSWNPQDLAPTSQQGDVINVLSVACLEQIHVPPQLLREQPGNGKMKRAIERILELANSRAVTIGLLLMLLVLCVLLCLASNSKAALILSTGGFCSGFGCGFVTRGAWRIFGKPLARRMGFMTVLSPSVARSFYTKPIEGHREHGTRR